MPSCMDNPIRMHASIFFDCLKRLTVVALCCYLYLRNAGVGEFFIGIELAKRDLAHIIKFCYKQINFVINASDLNSYNFRTVNAINFLFSPLHTTPFPYDKVYFGVLHWFHASVATSDFPRGSNMYVFRMQSPGTF